MRLMDPWYEITTPRAEVREGRSFNPDEFAIALEQVVAGKAPVSTAPQALRAAVPRLRDRFRGRKLASGPPSRMTRRVVGMTKSSPRTNEAANTSASMTRPTCLRRRFLSTTSASPQSPLPFHPARSL